MSDLRQTKVFRLCFALFIILTSSLSQAERLPTQWQNGTWEFKDCIFLSGRLALQLWYNDTGMTLRGPVTVYIPNDATVDNITSNCGTHVQTLTLAFFNDWHMSLSFSNSRAHGAYSGQQFILFNIKLHANLAEFPQDFPNPINSTYHYDFSDPADWRRNFSSPGGSNAKYLACDHTLSAKALSPTEHFIFETSQLKHMSAFGLDPIEDSSASFSCPYDRVRNDTWLLIVIGCEIGIVLLILFAYIVVLVWRGPYKVKLDENATKRWEVPTASMSVDSQSTTDTPTLQRRTIQNVVDTNHDPDFQAHI